MSQFKLRLHSNLGESQLQKMLIICLFKVKFHKYNTFIAISEIFKYFSQYQQWFFKWRFLQNIFFSTTKNFYHEALWLLQAGFWHVWISIPCRVHSNGLHRRWKRNWRKFRYPTENLNKCHSTQGQNISANIEFYRWHCRSHLPPLSI